MTVCVQLDIQSSLVERLDFVSPKQLESTLGKDLIEIHAERPRDRSQELLPVRQVGECSFGGVHQRQKDCCWVLTNLVRPIDVGVKFCKRQSALQRPTKHVEEGDFEDFCPCRQVLCGDIDAGGKA